MMTSWESGTLARVGEKRLAGHPYRLERTGDLLFYIAQWTVAALDDEHRRITITGGPWGTACRIDWTSSRTAEQDEEYLLTRSCWRMGPDSGSLELWYSPSPTS
jgi:hypothetical protein